MMNMGLSGQVSQTDLAKKADKIHHDFLTIDSHTDTPMHLMAPGFDPSVRHDPVKDHSKVDFPRMREGGMDALFFAVFVLITSLHGEAWNL